METQLRTILKPLYTDLLTQISTTEDVYPFCLQWGKSFPIEKNTGILFVGKATNGWINPSRDTEILFGTSKDRIFSRNDQMKWVHDLEGDEKYNTKKSAFWRVIKGISQIVYKNEPWYLKIAWSNLYKIGPEQGNPNGGLKNEQHALSKKILLEEIKVLSPKFVVFLTSGWEWDFVKYLYNNQARVWIESSKWDMDNEVKVGKVNDVFLICSQHPQGKNEHKHIKAITKIIERYSMSDELATKVDETLNI